MKRYYTYNIDTKASIEKGFIHNPDNNVKYKDFETLRETEEYAKTKYLATGQKYFALTDLDKKTLSVYDAQQEICIGTIKFGEHSYNLLKIMKEREEE